MVCCALLAGLLLFGPRGARIYHAFRSRRRSQRSDHRVSEVFASGYLVESPAIAAPFAPMPALVAHTSEDPS
jgi:hypothetical protein